MSRGRFTAGLIAVAAVLALAAGPADAAVPKCYGAAAHDSARPCHNASLRLSVTPTPSQALLSPGPRCTSLKADGLAVPCAFGTAPAEAKGQFALLGDSHANHWRAGLEVVARVQGSRGYEIARNSCPITMAVRALPEPYASKCVQFREDAMHWLAMHPTVDTVFMAELTRNAGEYPAGTADPFAAEVAGYAEAWKALPASVTRVVVIRDTPEIHFDTLACVDKARRRHRPAGTACSVPKAGAILPDPAAVAAAQLGAPRFEVIDLNSFFCGAKDCYPVIGGVLVYKDITHMTPLFAQTLGPYLLRALRQLPPV